MWQLNIIQKIIVWGPPILFAITVHEVAHGWMALKLGDKTALMLGRLTLNPLKHIDMIGTVIIPLILLLFSPIIFGWAKPVPVNPNNLKKPRRDMAFVAIAGPISNIIMALIWAAIMKIGSILMGHGLQFALPIVLMGRAGILINLVLMILNLIPIPPLDGSRVVAAILPPKLAYQYDRIAPYGFFILLLLLITGVLRLLLWVPIVLLQRLILAIFGLG
ncbi:MAG: site-2 protease family protein [Gammaproteobacteria bacterium]|jgi:Zn-dependent protease